MYTLTDLLNQYTDKTNDTSATNIARAVRGINQKQKMICNKAVFWWTKKTYLISTIATQKGYQLPVRSAKFDSGWVKVSNYKYPLVEISNQEEWDRLNAGFSDNYTSDVARYCHFLEGQIQIWPTPATSSNTINIVLEVRPLNMLLKDYVTGTVAVTNGSPTVTLSGGGSFTTGNVKAGCAYIFIDGTSLDQPYQILSVDSATQVTLVKNYEGANGSGLSYRVGDCPLIHEDYQDVLWAWESMEYWGLKKGDTKLYSEYKDYVFNEKTGLLPTLIKETTSESSSNVIQKRRALNAIYWFPKLTDT